ncbi:MAG: Gfo/Idh/MocA family oxidoreductase, partial [Candidatus Sumerlaeota bacterium]|nr:Gfo/Idh/MocA family oxidoreductase [Candidatus Sumerlaeota bacterium]
MSENENRRDFLKKVAIGAGAAAGAGLLGAPNILAQKATPKPKTSKPKTSESKTTETATSSSASSGPKLRIAVIGCGGQGTGAHVPPAAREQLVALVDTDEKNLEKALKRAKDSNSNLDTSKVQTFNDYRKMFDKVGKEIDAVLIATPNHHHCLPALMAMQLGKAAYVEKPMAYCIQEARTMAEYSRKYKVATQMGNQGHSNEGYRRLCEYIWAGAIGKVTEVFCWTNRANGGVGDRPPALPVPPGMHWDEWIGPAPFREYHKDLHPHEWHGWHDFGNGSLGNMACHVMDGAHWALKLGHPTSIEVEEMNGGTKERYPIGARIRWDFPARGDMPPVKVYWFDGKRPGNKSTEEGDTQGSVGSSAMNRPPLLAELMKKYNRKFSESGSLYVGDK